jgi:hypothetical protein
MKMERPVHGLSVALSALKNIEHSIFFKAWERTPPVVSECSDRSIAYPDDRRLTFQKNPVAALGTARV